MTLDTEQIAELADAITEERQLPAYGSGCSLEDAYRHLPDIVERVAPGQPCGLKVGLTDAQLQKYLGISQPLLGLLYPGRELPPKTLRPFDAKVLIECEIGVVLDSEGQLLAVKPSVELVRLDFASPETLSAADLVLANLGAQAFMCGDETLWGDIDWALLASEQLELICNDVTVLSVPLGEAVSSAEKIGFWVVEEANHRGLEVAVSRFIMTGTCGQAIPAEPGRYEARFGSLGNIQFSVQSK